MQVFLTGRAVCELDPVELAKAGFLVSGGVWSEKLRKLGFENVRVSLRKIPLLDKIADYLMENLALSTDVQVFLVSFILILIVAEINIELKEGLVALSVGGGAVTAGVYLQFFKFVMVEAHAYF